MKYLLDVNALIALGFVNHQFHSRVVAWVRGEKDPAILTCSITELGFVRILAQAPRYGFTVAEARELLLRLKKNPMLPLTAIADAGDISDLPMWAKFPHQVTDGHLAQLASKAGATLATFDKGIPGALLIP
jgi:predicted nucleic acid-binding protein